MLTLGFRNQWQYPWIPGWTGEDAPSGSELSPTCTRPEGPRAPGRPSINGLHAGVPLIAWVDPQGLGTWGLPDAMSGYGGLAVVVFGRAEDGAYLVDDRGRAPFRIPTRA